MYKKWKYTLIGIAIALFGFLFQISLQTALRPYAKIGIYFQGWSSETQMQTVSIRDLILFLTSKRTILIFLLVSGSVSGLYMIKQYNQFGTTSTSSFTGLNLNNSVGMKRMFEYTTYLDSNANLDTAKNDLANVLKRKKKINGAADFNHISYLKLNNQLI